jgi:hypothetical protein
MAMTQPTPPSGWYPDPQNPGMERWWQDGAWTGAARPTGATAVVESKRFAHWSLVGLLVSLVGVAIVLFTDVTVLSGMNQVVFGAIIASAGAVIALIGRRSIALRLSCVVLAVIAIAGAAYDQHQVDQKRQEIQQIFDSP